MDLKYSRYWESSGEDIISELVPLFRDIHVTEIINKIHKKQFIFI